MKDCKEWPGARDKDGYGILTRNSKWMRAHRQAWIDVHGEIPDGMLVLHECDNPPCTNVAHLKLGSHLDNTRDAIERKRRARFSGARMDCTGIYGDQHPCSKVTDAQREEIFVLYFEQGLSQIEIARRYGIRQTGVSRIIRKDFERLRNKKGNLQ